MEVKCCQLSFEMEKLLKKELLLGLKRCLGSKHTGAMELSVQSTPISPELFESESHTEERAESWEEPCRKRSRRGKNFH